MLDYLIRDQAFLVDLVRSNDQVRGFQDFADEVTEEAHLGGPETRFRGPPPEGVAPHGPSTDTAWAMSGENVDRLRSWLERWDPNAQVEALDWGEVPDPLIAPEVSFEDDFLPDHAGETYRGYEGLLRSIRQWLEPFERVDIELERIVGTGECLVSIHRVQVKARHTGIEFESPLAYAWTFRDGRVIHIHAYIDPTIALEAAGLSE